MTDYDDYDETFGYVREEPDCPPCMDSGRARPRRWWQPVRVFTRARPGRARCASCNPSPRQIRRGELRRRRDAERWRRDVAAGRIVSAAPDDAPF